MAYCKNCGTALVDNAKFCQKCGYPVESGNADYSKRQQEFVGKIYKCPKCGEVLKSFEINCPACGHELRGIKATSAVKEFALKLEAIELRREDEKAYGTFNVLEAKQRISKTDEQKISLIKSFFIPNTKEDMLEFMILATSNVNMKIYDYYANTNISKSEKEINDAWFSKVQQIYEKAKRSYSSDSTFMEIKALYDRCNEEIQKSKKKGILKYILSFGWIPIFIIILIVSLKFSEPKEEAEEIERLENIVVEVQTALDKQEYKHALRIADSIDYQRYDVEMERKWDIERAYWIEKIIEEAANKGIYLEYNSTVDIDNANDEDFMEEFQQGLDVAKENIDEFSRIVKDEKTSKDSNEE